MFYSQISQNLGKYQKLPTVCITRTLVVNANSYNLTITPKF